jgi:hypothetical protein
MQHSHWKLRRMTSKPSRSNYDCQAAAELARAKLIEKLNKQLRVHISVTQSLEMEQDRETENVRET